MWGGGPGVSPWTTGGLVESPVVCFNRGPCIFSHPSDAPLPGHHGFVKDDSLLLKIKMMQRLLRPDNESQLVFLY